MVNSMLRFGSFNRRRLIPDVALDVRLLHDHDVQGQKASTFDFGRLSFEAFRYRIKAVYYFRFSH